MRVIRFKKVAELRAGDMFGELGLIYNKPRLATIIAQQDVELGKLTKGKFNKSFGALLTYEDKIKKHFFENKIIKMPKLVSFVN